MSWRWSDLGLCHQVSRAWSCQGPWVVANAERGPDQERGITRVTPLPPGPGLKLGGVSRFSTVPGNPPLPLPGLSLLFRVVEGEAWAPPSSARTP